MAATEWYNVITQGGAAGDGSTDDTAKLQAAHNKCPPGGTLYYPHGVYVTSRPLTVPTGAQIMGPVSAQQSGNGWGAAGSGFGPGTIYDWGAVIKPSTSFARGTANAGSVLLLNGPSMRQVIENMWLDGTNLTTARNGIVHGITCYGRVKAVTYRGVGIVGMTGHGINNVSASGSPSAHTCVDMIVQSNLGDGFHDYFGDSSIMRCHSQSNHGYGFYFANSTPGIVADCRADMSGNDGFYYALTSSSPIPSMLYGVWTERNYRNGIHITTENASGLGPGQPVIISGASLVADGVNSGSGGGSYAGLFIERSSAVVATGLLVSVQTADVSGGCPQYGVRIATGGTSNARPMMVQIHGGMIMGADSRYCMYGTQVPLVRNYDVMGAIGTYASQKPFTYINYDSGSLVHI